MRTIISILLLSLVAHSYSVHSAESEKRSALPQILALDTKKPEIKFFKDQKGDVVEFSLPVKSLIFPLSILEEQGEYLKVMINDKSVWVSSLHFKLSRSCSDLVAQSKADKESSELSTTRGASNGKGCSK